MAQIPCILSISMRYQEIDSKTSHTEKNNHHYREGEAEPNRVRLTAGGNQINFPGDVGTPTADLLTIKLLINIVISTPGAE